MVVDDDGGQLRRGEIGVVEPTNKTQMVLGAEGSSEELLASSRREKNYRVAQVDHGDPTAVVEPPAMAHGRWD